MIQVTTNLDTPEECNYWKNWVESKGHKTEVRELTKNDKLTFALFRSYDQSELDTPEIGYWHVNSSTFCRTRMMPMKMYKSKCPTCKTIFETKKGENIFCRKCRPAVKKDEDSCDVGRQNRSKGSHK
jgi:hypothetical protein